MNEIYKKQVRLLLDVLPEIAKEDCFAMHGGTAINLFVQDMPRLSVDIDLTYVEIAERVETIDSINGALLRIKESIERLSPSIRVQHKPNVCKLQISERDVQVKVEVNMVGRGLLNPAVRAPLCESAQEQYDVFCAMPIVPLGQMYGGKLCAALDRQHPRDLFDTMLLLKNIGFTNEIKRGFLFALISSNRPTHEMLEPNLLSQQSTFENQFAGMTNHAFNYADYEDTRLKLIDTIKDNLDATDRSFLLKFNQLQPDWSVYDFERFPSVRWKQLNLKKFRANNPKEYNWQLEKLTETLDT